MEITSTIPTPVPPTVPLTGTTADQTIASDYDTFLLMMTTQIQNQDPLDPMNSDEFAVQLATFSGVEQQVETNALLASLNTQTTIMGMAQLASWVGNQARVAAPVYFDGSAVTLSPNPAIAADSAQLVVRDENGLEVGRETLPATTANYQWTGLDKDGAVLPTGIYNLTLESYSGTELLGTTEIESYATIEEARSTPSGTTLLLEGGIEVPSIYVTALRVPDQV